MCVVHYGCGETSDRKGRIYIGIYENKLLKLLLVPEADSDRKLKENV